MKSDKLEKTGAKKADRAEV